MRPLGKTGNPNNRQSNTKRQQRVFTSMREYVSASAARSRVQEMQSVFIGVSAYGAQRVWKRLSYSLFLAVFIYGMITGGHFSYFVGGILDNLDEFVQDAGFGITRVDIEGQRYVRDKDILTVLGDKGVSLIRFNTQQAREKIEQLEWVESARVMRLFPSTVKVVIKERKPYALWQTKGQYFLIDTKGIVINEQKKLDRGIVNAFPLIVGDGADRAAKSLFDELRKHPRTIRKLKAALRVAERRWNLQLHNGVDIWLPEKEVSHALKVLSGLDKQYGILSGNIQRIDLRLSDRVTLRRFKRNEAQDALNNKEKSYSQVHIKRSGA